MTSSVQLRRRVVSNPNVHQIKVGSPDGAIFWVPESIPVDQPGAFTRPSCPSQLISFLH